MSKLISFKYNKRKFDFYLTNQNDAVQNILYKYRTFYESTMLEDMAKRATGDGLILDVGAYFGNHSIFLGKFTRATVWSFEPFPKSFAMVKKNITLNKLKGKVIPHNMAIGSQEAKGKVVVTSQEDMGMNRVEAGTEGATTIMPLDKIVKNNKVQMIKIDVEGMELDVLAGAEKIIKKNKPLLYIEVGEKENLPKVKGFLAPFGYRIIRVFNSTPTYLFSTKKPVIGFWAGANNFNFLNDIMAGLSKKYEVKKFLIGPEYTTLQEDLSEVDLGWFEWAAGPLFEAASSSKITPPIITRLHRYEYYRDDFGAVNWERVNKLISVASFYGESAIKKVPLLKDKVAVIENGLDANKFKLKKRGHGNKVAFLGGYNLLKDPRLALLSFKELLKINPSLELCFAGPDKDEIARENFLYLLDKLGIKDNVKIEGEIKNVPEWLKDKNYYLCTSYSESQNLSIMEAMLQGIKPLVYGFYNAETIYDPKYIFYDFEDLKRLFKEEYISEEYRNFVVKRYDFKKKLKEVEVLIESTIEEGKIKPYTIITDQTSVVRAAVRKYVPKSTRKQLKKLLGK